MKDKNGKALKVGDCVKLPSPDYGLGDMWNHEFQANVVDVDKAGNLIVEDQDSDFFAVEAERVTLIDDEDY